MRKNLEIQGVFHKTDESGEFGTQSALYFLRRRVGFATRPQVTDSLNPRPQVYAVMVIAVGVASEEVRPTRK